MAPNVAADQTRGWRALDVALLATLVPLFIACLWVELPRIEIGGPAFYVGPAASATDYPRIAGFWSELPQESDLRVGDRVIRIGEADLAGAGVHEFVAIAVEQAPSLEPVDMVIERAGVQRTVPFRQSTPPIPWGRLPLVIAFALVGTIVLVRAPGTHDARLLYAAFLCVAISQTNPLSEVRALTRALGIFDVAVSAAAVLLLGAWARSFPPGQDAAHRVWAGIPWLAAAIQLAPRVNWMLGGPLPAEWYQTQMYAIDVALGITLVGVFTWNFRRADPVGRRQIKWVMLGAWVAEVPLTLASVLGALDADLGLFRLVHAVGIGLAIAIPLGVLLAIVRYNLFDINRLLSGTVSYSIVLVLLSLAGEGIFEPLAAALAQRLGFDPGTGQMVFVATLAVVLIPVERAWRPWVDRLFFGTDEPIEADVERLLEELDAHAGGSTGEVVRLLADRISGMFRPTFMAGYHLSGDCFETLFESGDDSPDRLSADDTAALVAALRVRVAPLRVEERGRRVSDPQLAARVKSALTGLEPSLLLPLRNEGALFGFLCLGRKGSGDVWTTTDVSLLASVSHHLSVAEVRG